MTNAPIEISEDEFDDRYPLLLNHLNPHASWAFGDGPGCLFESYGEELEFVRQQDPRTVWTLVDGDDGDQYLLSGFHFVNRIGYLVSTVAIPEEADIQVRIPMQQDPSDQPGEHDAAAMQSDQWIRKIALDTLSIPTLHTQGTDSLDFHDVAVWQVEAALKAAFEAGALSAAKKAEPQAAPKQNRSLPHCQLHCSSPRGHPLCLARCICGSIMAAPTPPKKWTTGASLGRPSDPSRAASLPIAAPSVFTETAIPPKPGWINTTT